MIGMTGSNPNYSIGSLVTHVRHGTLVPVAGLEHAPAFDVWQMSALVESLMLGIPCGELVVARTAPLQVVDGWRRLSAVSLFMDATPLVPNVVRSGFALTGLRLLPYLDGTIYARLDEEHCDAFDNATMSMPGETGASMVDLHVVRERVHAGYVSRPTPHLHG